MHDDDEFDDDEFDDEEDEDEDKDDDDPYETGFLERFEWGDEKKPALRLNYSPGAENVMSFSHLFMALRLSAKMMLPPLGPGSSVGFAHIKFPGEGNETIEMIHAANGITIVFETVESRDDIFTRIKNGNLFLGSPNYE